MLPTVCVMSELIHVRYVHRTFHDRNALVSDERLDELDAVEREVRAVRTPRDRRMTVKVRWDNGGRLGILHASEVTEITRLGDPRGLVGGPEA